LYFAGKGGFALETHKKENKVKVPKFKNLKEERE